jgi:hypothetical protein
MTTAASNENRATDLADAAKIRYLTPDNAVFTKTPGNTLSVRVGKEEHAAVYVHCSFPHTDKTIYLSIRTHENKEIGMVRSLDDFPPETAQLLEEQVRIRYFTPEITKVIDVRMEFGYSYWEAETTAGLVRFTVRGGTQNIKLVSDRRLLIHDVNGNRFVIPDIDALSDAEYRKIELTM